MYYVNVCGISYYSSNTYYNCKSGSSICRRDMQNQYSSYGLLAKQKVQPSIESDVKIGEGVTITYSDGDTCSSGKNKVGTVHIRCSNTADPGYLYDIKESDDCESSLYMYSVVGCAVVSKVSIGAGGIILIM